MADNRTCTIVIPRKAGLNESSGDSSTGKMYSCNPTDWGNLGRCFEKYKKVIGPHGIIYDTQEITSTVKFAIDQIGMIAPTMIPLIRHLEIVYTFKQKTMATDGIHIFINPGFAQRLYRTKTPAELEDIEKTNKINAENGEELEDPITSITDTGMLCLMFVIIHEAMHNVFEHPRQYDDHISECPDHKKANCAMDYEINYIIEHGYADHRSDDDLDPDDPDDSQFVRDSNGKLTSRRRQWFSGITKMANGLIDNKFGGMSWLEIYKLLDKVPENVEPSIEVPRNKDYEDGYRDGWDEIINELRKEGLCESFNVPDCIKNMLYALYEEYQKGRGEDYDAGYAAGKMAAIAIYKQVTEGGTLKQGKMKDPTAYPHQIDDLQRMKPKSQGEFDEDDDDDDVDPSDMTDVDNTPVDLDPKKIKSNKKQSSGSGAGSGNQGQDDSEENPDDDTDGQNNQSKQSNQNNQGGSQQSQGNSGQGSGSGEDSDDEQQSGANGSSQQNTGSQSGNQQGQSGGNQQGGGEDQPQSGNQSGGGQTGQDGDDENGYGDLDQENGGGRSSGSGQDGEDTGNMGNQGGQGNQQRGQNNGNQGGKSSGSGQGGSSGQDDSSTQTSPAGGGSDPGSDQEGDDSFGGGSSDGDDFGDSEEEEGGPASAAGKQDAGDENGSGEEDPMTADPEMKKKQDDFFKRHEEELKNGDYGLADGDFSGDDDFEGDAENHTISVEDGEKLAKEAGHDKTNVTAAASNKDIDEHLKALNKSMEDDGCKSTGDNGPLSKSIGSLRDASYIKVDWKKQLRRFMTRSDQSEFFNKKSYLGSNADHPKYFRAIDKKGNTASGRVVVFIDTSGSVGGTRGACLAFVKMVQDIMNQVKIKDIDMWKFSDGVIGLDANEYRNVPFNIHNNKYDINELNYFANNLQNGSTEYHYIFKKILDYYVNGGISFDGVIILTDCDLMYGSLYDTLKSGDCFGAGTDESYYDPDSYKFNKKVFWCIFNTYTANYTQNDVEEYNHILPKNKYLVVSQREFQESVAKLSDIYKDGITEENEDAYLEADGSDESSVDESVLINNKNKQDIDMKFKRRPINEAKLLGTTHKKASAAEQQAAKEAIGAAIGEKAAAIADEYEKKGSERRDNLKASEMGALQAVKNRIDNEINNKKVLLSEIISSYKKMSPDKHKSIKDNFGTIISSDDELVSIYNEVFGVGNWAVSTGEVDDVNVLLRSKKVVIRLDDMFAAHIYTDNFFANRNTLYGLSALNTALSKLWPEILGEYTKLEGYEGVHVEDDMSITLKSLNGNVQIKNMLSATSIPDGFPQTLNGSIFISNVPRLKDLSNLPGHIVGNITIDRKSAPAVDVNTIPDKEVEVLEVNDRLKNAAATRISQQQTAQDLVAAKGDDVDDKFKVYVNPGEEGGYRPGFAKADESLVDQRIAIGKKYKMISEDFDSAKMTRVFGKRTPVAKDPVTLSQDDKAKLFQGNFPHLTDAERDAMIKERTDIINKISQIKKDLKAATDDDERKRLQGELKAARASMGAITTRLSSQEAARRTEKDEDKLAKRDELYATIRELRSQLQTAIDDGQSLQKKSALKRKIAATMKEILALGLSDSTNYADRIAGIEDELRALSMKKDAADDSELDDLIAQQKALEAELKRLKGMGTTKKSDESKRLDILNGKRSELEAKIADPNVSADDKKKYEKELASLEKDIEVLLHGRSEKTIADIDNVELKKVLQPIYTSANKKAFEAIDQKLKGLWSVITDEDISINYPKESDASSVPDKWKKLVRDRRMEAGDWALRIFLDDKENVIGVFAGDNMPAGSTAQRGAYSLDIDWRGKSIIYMSTPAFVDIQNKTIATIAAYDAFEEAFDMWWSKYEQSVHEYEDTYKAMGKEPEMDIHTDANGQQVFEYKDGNGVSHFIETIPGRMVDKNKVKSNPGLIKFTNRAIARKVFGPLMGYNVQELDKLYQEAVGKSYKDEIYVVNNNPDDVQASNSKPTTASDYPKVYTGLYDESGKMVPATIEDAVKETQKAGISYWDTNIISKGNAFGSKWTNLNVPAKKKTAYRGTSYEDINIRMNEFLLEKTNCIMDIANSKGRKGDERGRSVQDILNTYNSEYDEALKSGRIDAFNANRTDAQGNTYASQKGAYEKSKKDAMKADRLSDIKYDPFGSWHDSTGWGVVNSKDVRDKISKLRDELFAGYEMSAEEIEKCDSGIEERRDKGLISGGLPIERINSLFGSVYSEYLSVVAPKAEVTKGAGTYASQFVNDKYGTLDDSFFDKCMTKVNELADFDNQSYVNKITNGLQKKQARISASCSDFATACRDLKKVFMALDSQKEGDDVTFASSFEKKANMAYWGGVNAYERSFKDVLSNKKEEDKTDQDKKLEDIFTRANHLESEHDNLIKILTEFYIIMKKLGEKIGAVLSSGKPAVQADIDEMLTLVK